MSEKNSKRPSATLSAAADASSADPWKERLRESIVKDRRRLRRNITLVAILLALAIAGTLWWLFPEPALPPMFAVAFDAVCLPGAEAGIRLQIEPAHSAQPMPKKLAGLSVVFTDVARRAVLEKTVTDRTGLARADVCFAPPAADTVYKVVLESNRLKDRSVGLGTVFFPPRDTSLVVVDIQDLFADPAQDLAGKDLNLIQPDPETVKLLNNATAGKKRIVYLSVQGDGLRDYELSRRWRTIHNLPPGPVLGRPTYHDDLGADEARRQIVTDLARHWQLAAVARRPQTVEFYRERNITCLK